MEKYESNSHKSKEKNDNEKKVKAVVKGKTKIKKKSDFRKTVENFLPGDISELKKYIINEIIFPTIRNGIEDVVHAILNGGEPRRSYGKTNYSRISSAVSKISYGSDEKRDYSYNARSVINYDEIIFDSRGDAEIVLEGMIEILENYPAVSIGDMYDLAQVSTDNYLVNKYGWTDIQDIKHAAIIRDRRGGFLIKLPRAKVLK